MFVFKFKHLPLYFTIYLNDLKRNILFLINPKSGYGHAGEMAEKALVILQEQNFSVEIIRSSYKDHLMQLIPALDLEQYSAIAVFGGDGTMHEVINGLMHAQTQQPPPLILFPAGSGNAFNHDLECLSFDIAIKRLIEGNTRKLDLFEVKNNEGTIYSFNMLGWGLVTSINDLAEKLRFMGNSRYTLASLLKIIPNPHQPARICFDGEVNEGDYSFVLIMNTKNTGKGMKMAPHAELSDGLMDVLIVSKTSAFKLLQLFPKIYSGKHIHSPLLRYIQTKQLSFETGTSQQMNIDGEVKGAAPFEVRVIQDALTIFV